MSDAPGAEFIEARYRKLEASHATAALIELPPPGAGRIWEIGRIRCKSDLAGKLITLKVGASIAALTQYGPTIPIGAEVVDLDAPGHQGDLIWSAGTGTSDNQAFSVGVTASARADIVMWCRSIPTPPQDTITGATVTTAS